MALQQNRPDAIPLLRQALLPEGMVDIEKEEAKDEDDEILNPLDMDVEDDEDLLVSLSGWASADMQQLNAPIEEEDEEVVFADFRLPPPEPLEAAEKTGIVDTAVQRIWTSAKDLAGLPDLPENDGVKLAVQPKEMWMLLLARLATRGGDLDRKVLGAFIAEDFAVRSVRFAVIRVTR
jgi:symplekin